LCCPTLHFTSTVLFFFMILSPPISTLFPYTTLFRSVLCINPIKSRVAKAAPVADAFGCSLFCSNFCGYESSLGSLGGLETAEVEIGEHTSELQSPCNLVCRLLLEKKKKVKIIHITKK